MPILSIKYLVDLGRTIVKPRPKPAPKRRFDSGVRSHGGASAASQDGL